MKFFKLIFSIVALSTILVLSSCNESSNNTTAVEQNTFSIDLGNYEQDALTSTQKYSLAYMWNEERLAYDIYQNLNKYHSNTIKQLENISTESEIKHIQLVENLVQWYDINITNISGDYMIKYSEEELRAMPSGTYGTPEIQVLYDTLYLEGKPSTIAALSVGCKVEVVDVNDLRKYITDAGTNKALIDTFTILLEGSYTHYWAFDKGLKSLGVSNGCASLGSEYTKSTDDYPSSK